jgi:hypothetical protein
MHHCIAQIKMGLSVIIKMLSDCKMSGIGMKRAIFNSTPRFQNSLCYYSPGIIFLGYLPGKEYFLQTCHK